MLLLGLRVDARKTRAGQAISSATNRRLNINNLHCASPSSTKTCNPTSPHPLACCPDHELKFKCNNTLFAEVEHKIIQALFQKNITHLLEMEMSGGTEQYDLADP